MKKRRVRENASEYFQLVLVDHISVMLPFGVVKDRWRSAKKYFNPCSHQFAILVNIRRGEIKY